jgi:hypothetical protein
MAKSFFSTLISGSVLLTAANAQNFAGSSRDEAAFQYIQPLNTTILTEYGSSPAVYPSRKFAAQDVPGKLAQILLPSRSSSTMDMLWADTHYFRYQSRLTLPSKHHWRWRMGSSTFKGTSLRCSAHHRREG